MARARGANAKAFGVFQNTPDMIPAGGPAWFGLPFVSHTLGEERPLIPSDLLGQGREMQDPTPDVATNDGDIVVPVDARNFGHWLRLAMGAPVSTGDAGDGYSHVFTSGAAALPVMAIEIGSPEVPAYSTHYGARLNQLKIAMSRSGLLNATCSLICIGESEHANASVAGVNATPSLAIQRFPQATGYVKKGGVALGGVVAADFTFSNGLEKIETIKADGRIEDSDPGMVGMTGSTTVRFADYSMLDAATSGEPIELDFGWSIGAFGLIFAVPRVFLPPVKRPISGPNGIQAQFNWQASGALGASVTATLTNDVAAYV